MDTLDSGYYLEKEEGKKDVELELKSWNFLMIS